MKFCTHCGSQVGENEGFCRSCGAPVGGNVNPQPTQGPQQYQQAPMYQTTATAAPKSKLAAGLLGIFLGSLGVHNFYLGNVGKGVAQLLLTVLSCGILALVSEIWGFIEGVMILSGSIKTDAKGNLLGD